MTFDMYLQIMLVLSLFAVVYGAYMIIAELRWYLKGAK